ncbi:hydroxyacid-oxoacid transhydrogenase [Oceanobacillus profundus]|uniref:hydroxyacid-oxoacid transhydrogenase n=1 Tax=Oceanobacillus profundus TaxID=372463 RepID=A0A417YNT7_9BACI|nr:hydroxyacid-oxoacid transhydrogenase [Oceanobacillus profundus]RHW35258.1 iron-containing alcohol dehydrogenase [Oceanobacillus profundus]
MTRNVWEYFSTQNIVFGNGSIHNLDKLLKRFEAKNVFLITDQGIVQAGILKKVKEQLALHNYEVVVYDQAVPEPPISSVMEAFEFAKSQMETDVIIGLGGGSSIDLAKVVALLMEHGGHPRDYFEEGNVPGPVAPLIAIPTTAGTGSEVTSVAVVNDTENNIKVGISDNYLRPAVALLDPELTVGLPPYVTACSGIDALSHAIESYTAKDFKHIDAEGTILFQGAFPITDALAEKAIELIVNNLTIAVQQGSNIEARGNMMLGSLLAGLAFSNAGNALAHAAAYPIGGLVNSPHGEVTGLLMAYVMRYNVATSKDKMVKIAKIFDLDRDDKTTTELAYAAADAVLNLLEEIGLPTKLSQLGIKEANLEEIADKSLSIERLIRNNPRVPRKDSLMKLLKEAY